MSSQTFDASTGKLNPPPADELAKLDDTAAVLSYMTGQMPDGRPYYAFVAVLPSRYIEFHNKTKDRAPLVLGEYGVVLKAGFEEKAPPDVVEYMHQEYGYNEKYESILARKLDAERKAYFKQQQEDRIQNALAMLIKKRDGGA